MPYGVAETSFASVVLIQGGSVAGRTDLSSRGMADEGREGNPPSSGRPRSGFVAEEETHVQPGDPR